MLRKRNGARAALHLPHSPHALRLKRRGAHITDVEYAVPLEIRRA